MSLRIIQYNPTALMRASYRSLPGISELLYTGKLFTAGLAPFDRSETIKGPLRMKSISPIPRLAPMKKTFEQLCNERAQEILTRADEEDLPIYTFWSGGIDSTLVLVSLLKLASRQQQERIVVLMTDESITENPRFFEMFIRGHLRVESAMMYPYLLGKNALIVSGEQNDQLLGFDAVHKFIDQFGGSTIHEKYSKEKFLALFDTAGDTRLSKHYVELFERVRSNAPIEIRTNFESLWWINFTMKWQNAHMRILSCTPARLVKKVTKEYVERCYISFYGTEAFQLWSMNNLDKRIKDDWRSYKWICKDIIYEFDHDAEYRANKTKRGSLRHVIVQQQTFNFIDEEFGFHEDLDPADVYLADNDFIAL